jgi:hypothetical protein
MWTHLVKRSIYMGIAERGRPKATRSKIGVSFRLALSEQPILWFVIGPLWIRRLASRIVVQHFMNCVYSDDRRGFMQAILLDCRSNASKSHKNHLIATDRMICELGFRPFRVRGNWPPPFLTPSNPIARFQVLNVSTSKSCVLCHR